MVAEVVAVYFNPPPDFFDFRKRFSGKPNIVLDKDREKIAFFTEKMDPISKETYRRFPEQIVPYFDAAPPAADAAVRPVTLYVRRTKALLITSYTGKPYEISDKDLSDRQKLEALKSDNKCNIQEITETHPGVLLTGVPDEFKFSAIFYFFPDRPRDDRSEAAPQPSFGKALQPVS